MAQERPPRHRELRIFIRARFPVFPENYAVLWQVRRIGMMCFLNAWGCMRAMQTEAATEAMANDGVLPETLVILVEE